MEKNTLNAVLEEAKAISRKIIDKLEEGLKAGKQESEELIRETDELRRQWTDKIDSLVKEFKKK